MAEYCEIARNVRPRSGRAAAVARDSAFVQLCRRAENAKPGWGEGRDRPSRQQDRHLPLARIDEITDETGVFPAARRHVAEFCANHRQRRAGQALNVYLSDIREN